MDGFALATCSDDLTWLLVQSWRSSNNTHFLSRPFRLRRSRVVPHHTVLHRFSRHSRCALSASCRPLRLRASTARRRADYGLVNATALDQAGFHLASYSCFQFHRRQVSASSILISGLVEPSPSTFFCSVRSVATNPHRTPKPLKPPRTHRIGSTADFIPVATLSVLFATW
jgi:hypothetical protein